MIFVGGIHGVGKSYFCTKIKNVLGINFYSASTLISELKKESFSKDKLISNIDENQTYLLRAIDKLNAVEDLYLLDGHFCLLNARGEVERIQFEIFQALQPRGIILLTEEPQLIAQRRKKRDGVEYDTIQIGSFQKEEVDYSKEVAAKLGISLHIIRGQEDMMSAISFIQGYII